jgi:hypothetical protein
VAKLNCAIGAANASANGCKLRVMTRPESSPLSVLFAQAAAIQTAAIQSTPNQRLSVCFRKDASRILPHAFVSLGRVTADELFANGDMVLDVGLDSVGSFAILRRSTI